MVLLRTLSPDSGKYCKINYAYGNNASGNLSQAMQSTLKTGDVSVESLTERASSALNKRLVLQSTLAIETMLVVINRSTINTSQLCGILVTSC